MPVAEHPVKMTDAEIADALSRLLRKHNIDPKEYELQLQQSSKALKPLQPTLNIMDLPDSIQIEPFILSKFALLARETINMVTIVVHRPLILETEHFNGLEFSLTYVEVRNTCGLPLRDVVVWLHATGRLTVIPTFFGGMSNPQHVGPLQPNENKKLVYLVRAHNVDDIVTTRLYAQLSAEVVPYVSRTRAYSPEFEVWPTT